MTCYVTVITVFVILTATGQTKASCALGRWGRDCSKHCNCFDAKENCEISQGKCNSDCAVGFRNGLDSCQKACKQGTFGLGCNKNCSDVCPLNALCRSVDGYCYGKPPFSFLQGVTVTASSTIKGKPDNILTSSQSECFHSGEKHYNWLQVDLKTERDIKWFLVYGLDCKKVPCSQSINHMAVFVGNIAVNKNKDKTPEDIRDKTQTCLKTTGLEHDGKLIASITCENTTRGRYLIFFSSNQLGFAICRLQLTGCHAFSYGKLCKDICGKCLHGKACNTINGRCPKGKCSPGYTGLLCNKSCTKGYYGINCKKQCFCPDAREVCNKQTGKCNSGCSKGYLNYPACNEPCRQNTFGFNCTTRCSTCLNISELCNHVTGACSDCPEGKEPPTCEKDCKDKYGINCADACHCLSGNCDPVSGACLDKKCVDGYMNDNNGTANCQVKACKQVSRWGDLCKNICHCKSKSPCVQSTGICPLGCAENFGGKNCDFSLLGRRGWTSETKLAIGLSISATILLAGVAIYVMHRRHMRKLTSLTEAVSQYQSDYEKRIKRKAEKKSWNWVKPGYDEKDNKEKTSSSPNDCNSVKLDDKDSALGSDRQSLKSIKSEKRQRKTERNKEFKNSSKRNKKNVDVTKK